MWVFYKSVSYINSMMRALWHSTAKQARKCMLDMPKCRDSNDTDPDQESNLMQDSTKLHSWTPYNRSLNSSFFLKKTTLNVLLDFNVGCRNILL